MNMKNNKVMKYFKTHGKEMAIRTTVHLICVVGGYIVGRNSGISIKSLKNLNDFVGDGKHLLDSIDLTGRTVTDVFTSDYISRLKETTGISETAEIIRVAMSYNEK